MPLEGNLPQGEIKHSKIMGKLKQEKWRGYMKIKWSLNKVLASSVTALLAMSCAYAIPRGPCDPMPEDVCCEAPRPGPFAFSYPKDMALSCPRDFYLFADFLVMQAKEDGLEYAFQNNETPTGLIAANFPVTGGDVKDYSDGHDWDWNWGIRLGLGFYLNHDAWNLDMRWTYIHVTDDSSSASHGGAVLIPIWLAPGTLIHPSDVNASSRWRANYNTFDLTLGKPYHISRYVVFNPYFGLRGAWIDQDYLAQYGGLYNDEAISGAEMDAKNDFWGAGIRAGLDTEWILGGGWFLFGKASASILFGKFDIAQTSILGPANNLRTYEVKDEFYHNSPNLDITMGISWGHYFNRNQHHIGLQIAYEMIQWWDQFRLRRFFDAQSTISNDAVSRGDLTFNGVSFRLIFNF